MLKLPSMGNGEQHSVREQLMSLNQYYIAEMKWMAKLLPLSFEVYANAARQKAVRPFLKRYFKDCREVLAALYEGLALLWMVDPDTTTWESTGSSWERQRSTRAFVSLARSNWLATWLRETRAYVHFDAPVTKSFGPVMTS